MKGNPAGLYGDVMMEIDWSVGQIMQTLKETGLEKNTLFIFTSDNGPWLNYGNHAGSTGGLREGKGTSYEGGQRVPCLMYWKGTITAGTVNNNLISGIDILPTLAEIADAPLPKKKIDGVSILPLIRRADRIATQSFCTITGEIVRSRADGTGSCIPRTHLCRI